MNTRTDCRDGCTTSEDIYWKLDALMNFVIDLNWPEEEFRRYLTGRMKNLTSEMITKVANWLVISRIFILHHSFSTFQAFDQWMQRSRKSTDYVLPIEVCVMVNVIFSSKARALRLKMDAGEVLIDDGPSITDFISVQVPIEAGRDP